MGVDYSINLYFPAYRLGDALLATARHAAPETGESTSTRLPDGRTIELPFRSGLVNDLVALKLGGGEIRLNTALLFPFNDVPRVYTQLAVITTESDELSVIAYIPLTVRTGCLFTEFSFTGTTSNMNRLFVDSASVRSTFGNLLRECAGVAAWLNQETFEFYRLDDPSKTFDPVPRRWDERVIAAGGEVDRLTESLARGLGTPVAGCRIDPRWRTANVTGVAKTIRAGREWRRLPILADALIDAGCDNDDVLAHCRHPGEHVKDCWVVNLLAADD